MRNNDIENVAVDVAVGCHDLIGKMPGNLTLSNQDTPLVYSHFTEIHEISLSIHSSTNITDKHF